MNMFLQTSTRLKQQIFQLTYAEIILNGIQFVKCIAPISVRFPNIFNTSSFDENHKCDKQIETINTIQNKVHFYDWEKRQNILLAHTRARA